MFGVSTRRHAHKDPARKQWEHTTRTQTPLKPQYTSVRMGLAGQGWLSPHCMDCWHDTLQVHAARFGELGAWVATAHALTEPAVTYYRSRAENVPALEGLWKSPPWELCGGEGVADVSH